MKTFLQGAVMGIVELIPGISGSTLALTMGIYDEFVLLLHQIATVPKILLLIILRKEQWKSLKTLLKEINFRFAILLIAGTGVSILLFANVLSYLLHNHPQYIYAAFCGIIIASLIIPYRALNKPSWKEITIVIFSFLVMFLAFGLTPPKNENPSYTIMFIGGIFGITGLFLPGVSGSFILLIMGIYTYVIETVKSIATLSIKTSDLSNFLVFILGLASGFIISAKLLRYLLKHQYRNLMAFVAGLLIASIRVLWPFLRIEGEETIKVLPHQVDLQLLFAISLIALLAGTITLAVARNSHNDNASLSEASR